MRIAVIGTGYVGLVTAACLAEYGNVVVGVDVDERKIQALQRGIVPIYEPGLRELIHECADKKQLHFAMDIKMALHHSDFVFIAVGTPQDEYGAADVGHVFDVADEIGRHMDRHLYVVVKSTVPVGTCRKVRERIQRALDQRESPLGFDVLSNPEFLKEGTALNDCRRPDRIVIGSDDKDAESMLCKLYRPFVFSHDRFICMDIESAEMTKYAANAMLATKISFMNEIGKICEKVGADVNKVRLGIGSDSRIGYQFIYPGCGYGGSCFPKDVRALINTSREYGYEPEILHSIDRVNEAQKMLLVHKIVRRFGDDLSGRTFGIWGLAFKPNTDDMRMGPAVTIVRALLAKGARIQAYDPRAMDEAKNRYFKGESKVSYWANKYDALNNADALVLITEWKEFRSPDFYEVRARLRSPCVFDGRNQYDEAYLKRLGIEYHQIGVRADA